MERDPSRRTVLAGETVLDVVGTHKLAVVPAAVEEAATTNGSIGVAPRF